MKPSPPRIRLALAVLAATLSASALARQDPLLVKTAVEEFLKVQTAGLPGRVSFTAGPLDPSNQLTPCPALEVSMPPGAKPWGRTNVAVRCQAEQSWNIFLPVHIRVVTDYLVAALPLAQGQSVTAADLARREGDLSDLPTGILTDEHQAIGRTVTMSVAAGRPLRADLLRLPVVVQQNQSVRVVSQGPGFQVANEGRALNNGVDGQVVQVRLNNGQIVSGIARTGGVVAIGF
jgi:flagellar basal body P-ring formation protein FlgA